MEQSQLNFPKVEISHVTHEISHVTDIPTFNDDDEKFVDISI